MKKTFQTSLALLLAAILCSCGNTTVDTPKEKKKTVTEAISAMENKTQDEEGIAEGIEVSGVEVETVTQTIEVHMPIPQVGTDIPSDLTFLDEYNGVEYEEEYVDTVLPEYAYIENGTAVTTPTYTYGYSPSPAYGYNYYLNPMNYGYTGAFTPTYNYIDYCNSMVPDSLESVAWEDDGSGEYDDYVDTVLPEYAWVEEAAQKAIADYEASLNASEETVDYSDAFVYDNVNAESEVYMETEDYTGGSLVNEEVGDVAVYEGENLTISPVEDATQVNTTLDPDANVYSSVWTERLSRADMIGRLYMADAGMTSVACINDESQSTTDKADSANIATFNTSGVIICDHCSQNFSVIKNNKVSAGTTATLDCGNVAYKLTCVDFVKQYEVPYEAVASDLLGAFPYLDGNLNGYVLMYTCDPDWPSISLTLWTVDNFAGLYSEVA